MRTNVNLDDQLIEEALKLSGLKTKKEVIDQALREFVNKRNRHDLRELHGKILFDETYNYKASREDNRK